MKIVEIKVLRGPNYWSVRRGKLIQMTLDLEEMEQRPTNTIPNFLQNLKTLIPTLFDHRCSEGEPGGFYSRVEEGTWMGHVIEHIALEIQTLAGMDTGFGRTRGTGKDGEYYVCFSYLEEDAGVFAAEASVRIAQALINDEIHDLAADIMKLREIREHTRLGPSTGNIVEEAARRGIPHLRLNKHSLVQLGYGCNQKRIRATIASTTGNIAVDIACDKEETKNLLGAAEIPVPKGTTINSIEGLHDAVEKYGFPLVIKPIDGNHGKGNTTNITTMEQAHVAFEAARLYSRNVIIEKYITGYDFRILVINYKFIAAARRTPAHVVGDGVHNIEELIKIVNSDPRRGYGHEKVLTQITVDQNTQKMLEEQELTLDQIPEKDRMVVVKTTANLSTGGTSDDITNDMHPANLIMCERIARIIGLDICGIDIMATSLSIPITETGGAVIEVNAAPGFRMHIEPSNGIARNVAEPVVDMLFPKGSDGRIPIIAVTGTNGKTTTSRLIAHIAKNAGKKVGYTTSDGVYIQNQLMMKGDCTGPVSAQFVLKDPTVDFAVLECARGGILRSGLAFRNCDVAVVTNVAEDHMGLGGINNLEQMAKLKSVVPETVFTHGYAVLNADDDLVYKMREELKCNVALFSMDENNSRIRKQAESGGLSAVYENGHITILKGKWKVRVAHVKDIPITFEGRAIHNISNVLAAVMAAYIYRDITIEDIKTALQSFVPSSSLTPGRLNFFKFKEITFLADFAHNPHGLKLLGDFVSKLDYPKKIGLISGTGDRRDEDIFELGALSAGYFDEIIIRCDKNLRGRTAEEIIKLLEDGVRSVDVDKPMMVIPDENEAIEHIYAHQQAGALYIIMCDVVTGALAKIAELKERELAEDATI